MRDRGIVLDPYLDHEMLVRVCEEVGVPVAELDPSTATPAQVRARSQHVRAINSPFFICISSPFRARWVRHLGGMSQVERGRKHLLEIMFFKQQS